MEIELTEKTSVPLQFFGDQVVNASMVLPWLFNALRQASAVAVMMVIPQCWDTGRPPAQCFWWC